MPEEELSAWQTTDESGRVTHLPRPACAIRVWDAATKAYKAVDGSLAGAPVSDEEVDKWHVLRSGPSVNRACLPAQHSTAQQTCTSCIMLRAL